MHEFYQSLAHEAIYHTACMDTSALSDRQSAAQMKKTGLHHASGLCCDPKTILASVNGMTRHRWFQYINFFAGVNFQTAVWFPFLSIPDVGCRKKENHTHVNSRTLPSRGEDTAQQSTAPTVVSERLTEGSACPVGTTSEALATRRISTETSRATVRALCDD